VSEPLPDFPYHPDPLATGSIEESPADCVSCGRARGFVYTGSVYAVEEAEPLCPWCIADGSAAAFLGTADENGGTAYLFRCRQLRRRPRVLRRPVSAQGLGSSTSNCTSRP
jgi:hypothetical protein